MNFLHPGRTVHVACLLFFGFFQGASTVCAADALQPADFAWRGTLVLPAGVTSLARVDVPVQALQRLQGNAAQDLRVFNAAGAVVPYAVLGRNDLSHPAPVVHTAAYPAFPLFAATASGKAVRGAVQVRVNTEGQDSSAWVRWDSAIGNPIHSREPLTTALHAVLFDTRAEKQTLDALELALEMPRNSLVSVQLSTSTDLKDWTTVDNRGPLFRFDGADAPASNTLVLRQPLKLEGRYLRLAWPGQTGVAVQSFTGRVASTPSAPEPVRAPLPAGVADGAGGLNWTLPFATPIAALHLQALQDNTLVPVRIQGRGDVAQPWRTLATSVVYRLDTVGQGSRNPPAPLHGATVRLLRVEAGQGANLPAGGLQASLEFSPLQVAFLASGTGPFTLAAGRSQTTSAAVDASLLGSVSPDRLNGLPLATITHVQEQSAGALAGAAPHWLPAGTTLRSAVLWLVLGVGVLALGAVAFSLMRQLAARR